VAGSLCESLHGQHQVLGQHNSVGLHLIYFVYIHSDDGQQFYLARLNLDKLMSDKILSPGDKRYSLIRVDNNFQLFSIPERYIVPFTLPKTLRVHGSPTRVYPKMGSLFCFKNIACHFLSTRLLY
jgi:hypothetical protein